MNRRARVGAFFGALLLLGLAIGSGLPASADHYVGDSDGSQFRVVPSDDLLPVQSVAVDGLRYFANPSEPTFTQLAQCVMTVCGPPSSFLIDEASQTFSGTMTVYRHLVIDSVSYDCADPEFPCSVRGNNGFTSHELTFSTVVPTTTVPPRATTTTRPPAGTPPTNPAVPTTTTIGPRPPQPGVTIPPTTRLGQTTTTVRGATTTTLAPTTTTTTTAPPPSLDGPTLVAVTPKNQSSGPPGGGLQVQGSGYTCETVYFFFDGQRVGSDTPDAAGNVSKGGLSVPGDAGTGPHQVTASCEASGDTVMRASSFEVLPVAVHRPAFVTSLPLPSQVSLDPMTLMASAAIAIGAIMLIAFPYELFNSTMEENYDEIRGWFGMGPRGVPEPKTRSHLPTFFACTAATAVATGFLSKDFGLNRTSVVLFIGIFVALLVMAVVFSLPADIGIRRQFGEWGKLNFLPGTVLIAIAMVAASRVLDFQPGFFYGALAGLAFRAALSEKVQGKMTAYNWMFSLAISVGAFFLRVPVSAAAAEGGRSIWWIGLEICLALIFLWGIEGLAVGMLPMKFLDGRKVFKWSRTAWAVLFFLGIFATVHVLLRPGSGYVGSTSDGVSISVMALFAFFGIGSILFWAYFRFRPERWVPVRT